MLRIRNLHAGYGHLKILHDVDLDVNEGEIVALVGPNGAGKSTILKALFQMSDISSGKISFNSKNLRSLSSPQIIEKGISFVNQGRIIFDTLTVEENLKIGLHSQNVSGEFQQQLPFIFENFPILEKRRKARAYTLSGGERQQLALARALMQKPQLLLMDEPTLGLAPKLRRELFDRIINLSKQGVSFLIVEQNAKLAIESAQRTYLLEQGKIVLSGGKEIMRDKRIKKVYLGGV